MTGSALLAVAVAAVAGLLAGLAWASARERERRERGGFRASPHYLQALHYLAVGQPELAASELAKVAREEPGAVEVQLLLGDLLREQGQVEKAIRHHQGVLAQPEATRSERAHGHASLAEDFRKAGFLDRARANYEEALELDAGHLFALQGLQRLFEDQRQWREAFEVRRRVVRLRKSRDGLVLGHLQAEMGREAARSGHREAARAAFEAALALDPRVFPAQLGLAELLAREDPRRAAALLEEAIRRAPERAYLALGPLESLYAACGEPSRFGTLCERLIADSPHDWRARLALARHLTAAGASEDALGLLVRAVEANPQVLVLHLELSRLLRRLGLPAEALDRYVAALESTSVYRDPHVCTVCRYRADGMPWRCPHCHEWGSFVEDRPMPTATVRSD